MKQKIWGFFFTCTVCKLFSAPSICHRGGKSTWPDRDSNPGPLADRASTLITELPSHTVDLWQFPPAKLDLSPHLLGTMLKPTRQSLCCSQPERRPRHWPLNVTGEEKAHGPTGTRTRDLSHTVQALWPLGYRATWSTRDSFPLLD